MSVNTDAPTIVNITKTTEYKKLNEAFGWSKAYFYQCNLNALKAAFITDDVRENLLRQLAERYEL